MCMTDSKTERVALLAAPLIGAATLAVAVVRRVKIDTRALLVERARQEGYDDGYEDGRRALDQESDGAAVLAFPSSAHQLAQQSDVRSVVQRVGSAVGNQD